MVYVFLLAVVLVASLSTGSFAAFFFSLVILSIGELFCRKTKAGRPNDAKKVFYITFIVYTLLVLVRIWDMNIPDPMFDTLFKTGGDEDGFFEKSQIAAKQSSFFDAVPNITNTLLTSLPVIDIQSIVGCPGYHMYIGLIGYIATLFFDGNAVIVQLLGSVLFSCLLAVELFKILSLYLPSKKSANYALLGMFCTAFLFYGVSLLRDIHIAFLYSLVFYIILQPFRKGNLIKLVVILLITASFRIGSGLFIILFVLYYIYRRFSKSKVLVSILALLGLIIAFLSIYSVFNDAFDRLMGFSSKTEEIVMEGDKSPMQIFYSLPTPFKEIAIISSSYLTPFMSWQRLSLSDNVFHTIYNFTIVVYEFFWFLVMWLTTKWCVLNKNFTKLPKQLNILLIIVLFYLFVSTSEFSVRRTMCMYPIIYLCFVYLRTLIISKRQLLKDLYLPLVFYLMGVFVFLI